MSGDVLPAVSLGDEVAAHQEVTLVDLLDRLLAGGVVITGDITLALADIDLVHLSLRLVVSSVPTLQPSSALEGAGT
jgi:gas vesicle protein GvpA/GvpJ/GvpM family